METNEAESPSWREARFVEYSGNRVVFHEPNFTSIRIILFVPDTLAAIIRSLQANDKVVFQREDGNLGFQPTEGETIGSLKDVRKLSTFIGSFAMISEVPGKPPAAEFWKYDSQDILIAEIPNDGMLHRLQRMQRTQRVTLSLIDYDPEQLRGEIFTLEED